MQKENSALSLWFSIKVQIQLPVFGEHFSFKHYVGFLVLAFMTLTTAFSA